MKNLYEFELVKANILEDKVDEKTGERVMKAEVKWQHADIVNGNNRSYPKHVLKREIERLGEDIRKGKILGCHFHPKGDAEINDVSHIWEDIKMEEDGSCTGVIKILPTSSGKNAMTILRNGGFVGLSSRGNGTTKSVTKNGKTYEEVGDDYVLKSPGDMVLSPSVQDATVVRVLENKANAGLDTSDADEMAEFEEEYELNKHLLGDDEKEEKQKLEARFVAARRAGYKGSYEQFLESLKEK